MNRQKPDTGTQTGTRGKHGGTHLAKRAGNKKRMAIVAFMAFGIA